MVKISKKAMVEEALKKYTPQKIEEAKRCEAIVCTKDWKQVILTYNLTNHWLKKKAEKIKSYIWWSLKNDAADDYNKRPDWNTNSRNIESIKISLIFK